MSPGYTVAQTARLVAAVRWAVGRSSDIVGEWALGAAAGSPAMAVWMTVLSRRLAEHRESLASLQPDSVLMEPYREAAPPDPSVQAAVEEIAALRGDGAQFAAARLVLVPQLAGACDEVCAHAAPHCDAPLARMAETISRDLNRLLETAGDLGGRADAGTDGVARCQRRLEAAGGLVPRPLLRPEG